MKSKSKSISNSIKRKLPKIDYNDNRYSYKLMTTLNEIGVLVDYFFEDYIHLGQIKDLINHIESLIDNKSVFTRIRHLGEWYQLEHFVCYILSDDSYFTQHIEHEVKYGTGACLKQLEDKETIITILNTGIIPVKVSKSEINHDDLELTE